MATEVVFTSSHQVGDAGYIFSDIGTIVSATITALNFRVGFDPLSFNADEDFIYTTSALSAESVAIQRPQGLFFDSLEEAAAYVNPPEPEP